MKRVLLVVFLSCMFAIVTSAQTFSVTHYDLTVELDLTNKSLQGQETLKLFLNRGTTTVEFDCGDLTIDSVQERERQLSFTQVEHHLRIQFSASPTDKEQHEIVIAYHGSPRHGIRFFPERTQVYTVFSTSQWMVTIDDPNERATLRTKLTVPAGLTTVGNGEFVARRMLRDGKVQDEWSLSAAVPSYTFGFVIGKFQTVSDLHRGVRLNYLGNDLQPPQLRQIFRDTADMIDFYEQRSGVPYPGKQYTQVLAAGGVEQEMARFTALREKYGTAVLANDHDVWLGAHELAHQWWGIGVGCQAWTHFWLNEGMATFMADAYKERRFGRAEYLKEIESSRQLYEKVRLAGKDRSLVFPDWLHPTAEDRTLVYDKGAYVLHLLRLEMGEHSFWKGLRAYTKEYFGKSVVTSDFQRMMQKASSKDLTPFFDQWVYLR
jgi:aminopeptidase N